MIEEKKCCCDEHMEIAECGVEFPIGHGCIATENNGWYCPACPVHRLLPEGNKSYLNALKRSVDMRPAPKTDYSRGLRDGLLVALNSYYDFHKECTTTIELNRERLAGVKESD